MKIPTKSNGPVDSQRKRIGERVIVIVSEREMKGGGESEREKENGREREGESGRV